MCFFTIVPLPTGGNVWYTRYQSPTLGVHTHAHGFWVGINFEHPCIQLQIGVKLLGCGEYANQEALRAEARDSEQPFICPIQPRLGVCG
jgi:hypothetical protein